MSSMLKMSRLEAQISIGWARISSKKSGGIAISSVADCKDSILFVFVSG